MSKQEYRPSTQEIFTNAVERGPVFDKDQAAESLSHFRDLLMGADVRGKSLKRAVSRLETQVYGGGIRDQIKAADVLETACDGLTRCKQPNNSDK